MNQSEALKVRLLAKFPDCDYTYYAPERNGVFVSMEAAGREWRVEVTTRHSYAVSPPDLTFVLKYGPYSQEVHGSVKDAEDRMCQIISDLPCRRPRSLANIVGSVLTDPSVVIAIGLMYVMFVAKARVE